MVRKVVSILISLLLALALTSGLAETAETVPVDAPVEELDEIDLDEIDTDETDPDAPSFDLPSGASGALALDAEKLTLGVAVPDWDQASPAVRRFVEHAVRLLSRSAEV